MKTAQMYLIIGRTSVLFFVDNLSSVSANQSMWVLFCSEVMTNMLSTTKIIHHAVFAISKGIKTQFLLLLPRALKF